MADLKISQLTAATTPLAGTEVLPIVQSGSTKKATIDSVVNGRDITPKNISATGPITTTTTVGANTHLVKNTDPTAASFYSINSGRKDFAGMLYSSSDVFYWNTGAVGNTMLDQRWSLDYYNGSSWASLFDVDTSGNAKISTGNLVIGTSGKGIDFSATPGTGTSELLADYEEGTWTPTGFGITFASASGKYTKVGNLVTCTFFAAFPTTADGNIAYITGLPFVAASEGGVGMSYYSNDLNYAVSSGNSYLLPFNEIASGYKTNADLSAVTVGGSFSYQV
jgi:hypothetical protein